MKTWHGGVSTLPSSDGSSYPFIDVVLSDPNKRTVRALYVLACETELSLMIRPGISLNGKQRSGIMEQFPGYLRNSASAKLPHRGDVVS
jgi:hypothetical protein